jgi:membrane fusion protein, copper/silver efflux system
VPFTQENQGRQRYRYFESVLSRFPRLSQKSWTILGAAVLLFFICFIAGSWYGQRQGAKAVARKILYYVDPMNPAHTSPEPGLAPCGMKLEPVYADEVGNYPESSLAPGTVRVTPRKQQLIGVRLGLVEKAPYTHTLRALGRVAVDERLIYRLNSAVDGWIREVGNNSTGSVVKKNETLAIFYSPLFLPAQQAYIYALGSLERYQTPSGEVPAQTQLNRAGIQQNLDSLRNLGVSDQQVKEIEKTRQYTENIRLVAPATSFVLARNVSAGQRFDKGVELYRLADLSRVWVLVDLYENEAGFIRPGERVQVRHPYQKKVMQGVVSDILPQFDPTSRTLKVRLEVENPDFALRPDMFMDVDFQVTLPETVSIPTDAVLDSGLRKTVFVDLGEGFFEPRTVETGWRLGDRVQILKGLQLGDKIVVSGNFLIDSESRMKLAAAGMVGDIGSDVVCSKLVDERKAAGEGRSSRYQGKTYFFCTEACKQHFDQDPERFVGPASSGPAAATSSPSATSNTPQVSPAAPVPVVASPPPSWQPPVIPPAAPRPPVTPTPAAGAPAAKEPPTADLPAVKPSPGECSQSPNLSGPGGAGPPLFRQPTEGPGPVTSQEQHGAKAGAPEQQPGLVTPGPASAPEHSAKSGDGSCHD